MVSVVVIVYNRLDIRPHFISLKKRLCFFLPLREGIGDQGLSSASGWGVFATYNRYLVSERRRFSIGGTFLFGGVRATDVIRDDKLRL
jgi:hypothetical protein